MLIKHNFIKLETSLKIVQLNAMIDYESIADIR